MKKILIPAMLLMATACTSPQSAEKILKSTGHTDIEIGGYEPFACSENDTFHTGFRAKGPSGEVVSGTVCAGLMKGSTIRYD